MNVATDEITAVTISVRIKIDTHIAIAAPVDSPTEQLYLYSINMSSTYNHAAN